MLSHRAAAFKISLNFKHFFLKVSPGMDVFGSKEKCELEGAAERSCYGLTLTSHSPSPCNTRGKGGTGV